MLTTNACVMKDGMVNYAIQSFVILAVMNMDSVRMEPVCASLGGMESIARLKAAREGKIGSFFPLPSKSN